jgi:NAD(P)-dependent dehydrogenase (short-subunit alcohol dehydrogenase family)
MAMNAPDPGEWPHRDRDARGAALVIGTGGIGSALVTALEAEGRSPVIGLGRHSDPPLDLLREESIAAAASWVASQGLDLSLVILATGFLHDSRYGPERSQKQLDAKHMAQAFALNAIGPALVMKHMLPLLRRDGRAIFAALSARVGSIGDNRLGGWHSYRASKAALNQFVRTAAVELRRTHPEALCVALHPGTVATRLSAPYAKTGLEVQPPALAARRILDVLGGLGVPQSGGFFDHLGKPVAW